jgi:hypothetical protein
VVFDVPRYKERRLGGEEEKMWQNHRTYPTLALSIPLEEMGTVCVLTGVCAPACVCVCAPLFLCVSVHVSGPGFFRSVPSQDEGGNSGFVSDVL